MDGVPYDRCSPPVVSISGVFPMVPGCIVSGHHRTVPIQFAGRVLQYQVSQVVGVQPQQYAVVLSKRHMFIRIWKMEDFI